MIFAHELHKTVGDRVLFSNLTLFLPKASYTLMCGERQSGKTTLVRMLLAEEKPDSGALTVDGIDIGSIPASRIPFLRRQIGLIAETPALIENRSVIENISIPLHLAGLEPTEITRRLDAILDVTGLSEDSNTTVSKLSGKTRQLVSTARAVIHKPPIVVADEPLHALDDLTAEVTMSLLNEAHSRGATVLITCQSEAIYTDLVPGEYTTLSLNAGANQNHENNNNGQDSIA